MMRRLLYCALFGAALLASAASAGQSRRPDLAGQTVVTEKGGRKLTREYAKNGQLVYEVIEKEGSLNGSSALEATEREWSVDGKPLRDQTFLNGKEIQGKTWYMNGKVKEMRQDQSRHEPGGPPGTYVERFSDLGVLLSAGVYQGQFRPVGVHREYDENGALKREITYGANGERLAEKTFDGSGAQTSGASYYPDGSRKLD